MINNNTLIRKKSTLSKSANRKSIEDQNIYDKIKKEQ